MLKRVAVNATLGVFLLFSGVLGGTPGHLNTVRAQPAAPCSRAPIQCPSPVSFRTFISNNLEPDSSGVCRFEERVISKLELSLGENVTWQFCNACDVDMEVQLDTSSPGPFSRFDLFIPFPGADNQVNRIIPCHDWQSVSGIGAKEGEPDWWKYTMRARPASNPTVFPDVIDPELVIDDSPGLHRHLRNYGVPIGLLLLGLLIGWLVSRRRR